ncbi:MAG: LLM class flavin-dependent oxidoreductase [Chloroflexi bacterium]|nr:LLM class flavin-dependent oxidoreductase [Chloroflexota bacterium]
MIGRIGFGAFYSHRSGLTPGEFARRLEDLGFDGFWAGETPTNRDPSYDSFTTLCFAAAATSRITVGSDVLLLPLHHPGWVAKQFGTLDVLSNGRAILGVGVGGEFPKQFEGFGIPLNERGRRTDEGIEIIRSLWTEDESGYDSPRFRFEGITMEPKPVQQPHPPIWVGGRPGGIETGPDGEPRFKSTTGAIQRAAKYADAWDPYYMTPEMYRESVTAIRAHASEIGRDISGMEWALTTFWLMRDSYDEALEAAAGKLRYGRDLSARVARYDILGSPTDVIRRLETFIDAGVRYFICNWSCDPSEVPRHLELIGSEVIPHFR